MIKSCILSLIALVGIQAGATTAVHFEMSEVVQSLTLPVEATDLLNWKVGDTADYKVSGGIINGTMQTRVREAVSEGYWVQQDMDLGFMGKQKVEILYDKNSGQVLQLLVNGKKQTPPDASYMEIIETKSESISVPKGKFDCYYVKILNKKENQTSEVWLNAELIPMGGMVKTLAPSQIGTITIELTNYRKQ